MQVASYNGILEFAFKFEINCSAVELDPNSYIANHDVILEVLEFLYHCDLKCYFFRLIVLYKAANLYCYAVTISQWSNI